MIVLSCFRSGRLAIAVCLTLILADVADCDAADAPATPALQNVSLGVDGLMKPGSWCRIRATVSGSDVVRVEAVSPDPLGHPVIYSSGPFESGGNSYSDLFIKPGRLQTSIVVRVVKDSDGTVLDSRRFVSVGTPGSNGDFRVARHSIPTVLFCGGFSGGTVSSSDGESSADSSATLLTELQDGGAEISQVNPGDLPTDWRTLAAYRTLILSREFDLSPDQSRAVKQWVSQGGHLVIVAGIGARAMATRTPGETVAAMLDLLDAGGLRALQTDSLASVLTLIEGSAADELRATGVPELLDQPLDRLPEVLDSLKLEPAKSRQLRDALRSVHRDLIAVAQQKINTTLKDGAIGEWALPSATLNATTLSDLTGLETLISSSWSIPVSGRHWGSVISDENATTIASGLEGTLLTRSSHGCGRITLCGVALDQSPVSRWKEVRTFLQSLIDQPKTDTTESGDRRRISSSGIEDLGTQLYAAVESVPNIEERNTLGVLGLTLLYLLLIGPVDYYLVHRLLKKPQLTWLTFPLVVVLAGLLGNASASARNSGDIETRRLEIVDFDQASGFTRTTTLSTVFSPQHARYEVGVPHMAFSAGEGASASTPSHLSWFGFPEVNYGGMYRSAGVETGRPQFRVSVDNGLLENVPIAIWSDRVVVSESLEQIDAGLIESDLKRTGTGQLHRDSTITHHLPFGLKNWMLIHGNRIYYRDVRTGGLLDDTSIPPGQTWRAGDSTVTGREVRSFLTGAEFRFTEEESKTSAGGGKVEKRHDKWDSRSKSLRDIVQMLTFHEIAGGSNYTGLSNNLLQELELSEHIELGRAILFAEFDGHVTTLNINGQEASSGGNDTATTIVRILLPVTEAPIDRTLPKFNE